MHLKDTTLFQGLAPHDFLACEAVLTPPHLYPVDTAFMRRDDETRDVFLVMAGKVRLSLFTETGACISVRDVLPGDYFGWLSAMDGEPRIKNAVTLEPSDIVTIPAPIFNDLVFKYRSIHDQVMGRMCGVVRRYSDHIEALTTMPTKKRILSELRRRADDETSIAMLDSHEDLATWTGTTRETVTRMLSELEREGVVVKVSGGYRVVVPA